MGSLLALVVILGLALVAVVYAAMVYNSLVQVKHNVAKAWANIDVLLKQRHDELPKLIDACKEYMKFEQETLQKVIDARAKVFSASQQQNMPALGAAEADLRNGIGRLFALAESYPDLKTNQSFQQLQARISSLENGIADRREFYNESVNINNVRIEQFPDAIVANMFGFKPFGLLQFEAAEKTDVDVAQRFKQ
jgi:LemA protein